MLKSLYDFKAVYPKTISFDEGEFFIMHQVHDLSNHFPSSHFQILTRILFSRQARDNETGGKW